MERVTDVREEVAEERRGKRCSRAVRGGREHSLVSRGELERGKRRAKVSTPGESANTCSTSSNKGHPPGDSHLDFHKGAKALEVQCVGLFGIKQTVTS